jgi:hypothetical protein
MPLCGILRGGERPTALVAIRDCFEHVGIPSETIQKLVGLLSGSSVSLYSSLRVEMGSWWLPVLQFGKESYGPALRVDEFRHVLDDLREQVKIHRYASQGLGDPKHGKHSRFPNC